MEFGKDRGGSGDPVGPLGAIAGVGVVFMAYEGFQLLSYDYGQCTMRSARYASV